MRKSRRGLVNYSSISGPMRMPQTVPRGGRRWRGPKWQALLKEKWQSGYLGARPIDSSCRFCSKPKRCWTRPKAFKAGGWLQVTNSFSSIPRPSWKGADDCWPNGQHCVLRYYPRCYGVRYCGRGQDVIKPQSGLSGCRTVLSVRQSQGSARDAFVLSAVSMRAASSINPPRPVD